MKARPDVLRFKEGGGHTRVQGVLDCDRHKLPFSYKVKHDDDPKEHEKKLDAHHAKGLAWVGKRKEFARWQGAKERNVHVRYCDVRAFGPHDWRATVIWFETINGVETRHIETWQGMSPGDLPKLDAIKEKVHGKAAKRLLEHAKVSQHAREVRRLKKQHADRIKKEKKGKKNG